VANIFDMLKQAHTLKREMGKVSEGLAGVEAEGTSCKGPVSVRVDGTMKITKVTIGPELLARGDARALEEMVLEAAHQAREKVKGLAAESMKKIAGDLPLPF
jgi:nucleoid-associated protein EbfC